MTTIKPFAQPEFTQFHNAALDHIMPKCKPNTWKIICATIRKTTGWHKDEDWISISQFMKLTGIVSRSTCSNAIKDAVKQGYITKKPHGNSWKFALNKEYEIRTSTETVLHTSTKTVPSNGTETVHTKETNTKQTIIKDKYLKAAATTPPTKSNLYTYVYVLGQVTGMDIKINSIYGRLAKVAKELERAEYSAEEIGSAFGPGSPWYKKHWKGKKGDKPNTKDITTEIASLLKSTAPAVVDYTGGELAEFIES
jgi:hypothetical protein